MMRDQANDLGLRVITQDGTKTPTDLCNEILGVTGQVADSLR